ncbi:unnamed protein product [Dovyalis caffra]|uniref:PXMP2/4 family protein 4 n=1 Tax=Dovyalis caffra TaxID=77055 RepID=A0AAV1SAB1_9ROSI|nr:unnamed protein product [Dovyalis caffra]
MGSISIRTISKRFLYGNFIRQTFIKNPESLSAHYRSSKTRVSYTLYKPSLSHPFSTSSSRSSCSNSQSKFRFIGWYLNQLESHPVVTKTFTTSLIYAAADLTAQMISLTSSSSFDLLRTLRMAGYGLLFLGPSQHLWFNFMSKVLPKRDVLTTFKKIFMGQTVYGPANATLFFSYNAALQGHLEVFLPPQGYRAVVIGCCLIISHLYKSVEATPESSSGHQHLYLGESGDEIIARLKRDLLPTLKNGLLYWPACDFATFKFVPVHLQGVDLGLLTCGVLVDNRFLLAGIDG